MTSLHDLMILNSQVSMRESQSLPSQDSCGVDLLPAKGLVGSSGTSFRSWGLKGCCRVYQTDCSLLVQGFALVWAPGVAQGLCVGVRFAYMLV